MSVKEKAEKPPKKSEVDAVSISGKMTRHWLKKEVWLSGLAIAVSIGLCVAGIYYKDYLMGVANLGQYSLLGMFIIALLAGSVLSFMMAPAPYVILVFTLPGVLSGQWGLLAPVWVGMVSAFGASLGQLITFMIGYGGGKLSQKLANRMNNGVSSSLMDWAKRHGSWAVFLMSAIFNPFHMPMTVAIAFLRYPPLKFYIFSLLGNAVKSLFIAFCGYFGLSSLFHFLGF